MKNEINWETLPFDHSGRWEKNQESLMNPGTKITWPQVLCEYIVLCRIQAWSFYSEIKKGPKWYDPITKHVRSLNQQMPMICNYFPHPKDEPLVTAAFKSYMKKYKPLKIGGFRKTRVKISQDEKDFVTGVNHELEKLIKQRNLFTDGIASNMHSDSVVEAEKVKFETSQKSINKNNLASLMELEKKVMKNG